MIEVAPGRTTDQTLSHVQAFESPATMCLIIEAGRPDQRLRARLEQLADSIAASSTELRVICDAPWPQAPPGVTVVVSTSPSRGDQLDRACEGATGDLLAFIDASTTLPSGWQNRAFEIFADPSIGAAGGPHLVPAGANLRQRAASLALGSWVGSGPTAYRFRNGANRDVLEMPTTNIVVRRSAYEKVGGFQSPSPMGDDARLCYKLRRLLGLRVVYDAGLAVEAPLPEVVGPLMTQLGQWGRMRGDLARRLPEICRGAPYALPTAWLLLLVGFAAGAIVNPFARFALLAVIAAYSLAAVSLLVSSRDVPAAVLAAVALPIGHVAYGVGFLGGYLGPNLADTKPGRFRPRQLRILIMNWRDITHPWAGGAEAYMHEVARRWVRDGCDVGWLCGHYRGAKRVETIDGVRVHRVGGHFTLYPLAAITYLLRLRNRYDVIVDCENGIPFFSPIYSRKPVVLVVFHVHAEVFRTELPKHLSRVAMFLEGWLMPRVYRRTELVTISSSTRHDLEKSGYAPERISIVESGVDEPSVSPMERSADPLLLCLGRLKRYKSVDVLLQAMPAVITQFPRARLLIIGQGPDRSRLERIAWNLGLASNVRFCGYLDRRTRDALLATAWLTVCPSSFEGYGVVCLEANALGTPVVAARVAGLRDAVRHGETGVLVPHGDRQQLADALLQLLADPVSRQRMGESGREWAKAHSWDTTADRFLRRVMMAIPVAAPERALVPEQR